MNTCETEKRQTKPDMDENVFVRFKTVNMSLGYPRICMVLHAELAI